MRIKMILTANNLYLLTKVDELTEDNDKKNNIRALSIIGLTLSDSILILIQFNTIKTARELWIILETRYGGQTTSAKLSLLKQLSNLRMDSSSSLSDHLVQLETLFQQLSNSGENLSETNRFMNLLRSLSPKFNLIVTVIENTTIEFKYGEIVHKLLNEEKKLEQESIGTPNQKSALYSHPSKYQKKIKNYNYNQQYKSSNQKQCSYCKKNGHTIDQCYKRKKKDTQKPQQFVLVAHQENEEMSWIIDSGASIHMSGDIKQFSNIESIHPFPVILANNEKLLSTIKGEIKIFQNDSDILIKDVYYVDGLKKNLISVKVLTQKGFYVSFQKEICSIKNKLFLNPSIKMDLSI